MKNFGLKLVFLICTIPLFLTACEAPDQSTDAQPELTESVVNTSTPPRIRTAFPTEEILRGTVTIRHAWDETRLPILASIIKSFQTYHPDVMFDVLYNPAETLQDRFIADTAEGLGPALLLGPAEWAPELYRSGYVSDISAEFDNSLLGMLNQAARATAQVDEALVGLPYMINGVTLFRNKDVITIPATTFDELVTLAQTSTQGATIGAYLERSFYYSGGHLISLGGQWIDANGLPGFNNGKGILRLQMLKDFEQAGPVNYFSDEDLERFKLGEVGWIIDGTWNMRELADALGIEKLAIDPWPAYQDGKMSGFVLSENVYLNERVSGNDRRAAIEFMRYLVMPEAQSQLANSGLIPASATFRATGAPYAELISQASQALAGGVPYPMYPEFTYYNLNLDIALRAYFEQNLPPEQVLQSAQDAILSELAKTPIP